MAGSARSARSDELLALGRRVLLAFGALPGAASAAVSGSVAEGCADASSDLDLMIYYDALPPVDALARVRDSLTDAGRLWGVGDGTDGALIEAFMLDSIECQVVHTTIERWERDIEAVLAGEQPASPLHKAMSGTLTALPVLGADRFAAWQARIRAYPDVLRVAMIRHHLAPPALWRLVGRLETRDAPLWWRQMLLDSSFALLGVAAGLSRRYFTPFQFKRTAAFVASLDVAPRDFGARLLSAWDVPPREAAATLRDLWSEMADLVERETPDVDVAALRQKLTA